MTLSDRSDGNRAASTFATQGAATVQLRILATTDIHLQLTGFDYVTDRDTPQQGLAGLGTLIEHARQDARDENRACLLFDNGDLLQGTPMGDHLAHQPVTRDHPAIACVNHLRYDALGAGNHDLDFGVPYFREVAAQLDAPVVASNLFGDDLGTLNTSVILNCAVPDDPETVLRVGVLSVLPRQTEIWNHHWLEDHTRLIDAVDCLRDAVPALRARGADLVVVLAHMGIDQEGSNPDETALELAKISGIDAMITGHTHRRFPGRDHRHGAGVDTAQGRLFDVPTVMPGHGGSDLGILDLTLKRDANDAWQVIGHVSKLRESTPATPAMPALIAATALSHEALRTHLSAPMGQTSTHLHNYFSLAAPASSSGFAATAKARAVRAAVAGTAEADLPLISSASGHTAGGREGPEHYVSIPQGNVLRRHLAGLNPYNNQVWAMRITGGELRRWLEHAALVFAPQSEDRSGVPLLRAQTPAFNFETVYGVTYTIDPTQADGGRIGNLQLDGVPVRDDQWFLLATNQFRVAGGGGFEVMPTDRVVLRLPRNTEAMFAAALAASPDPVWETGTPSNTPWRFDTPTPVETEIHTSPHAAHFLDEIAHLEPRPAGQTDAGFLRLKITL